MFRTYLPDFQYVAQIHHLNRQIFPLSQFDCNASVLKDNFIFSGELDTVNLQIVFSTNCVIVSIVWNFLSSSLGSFLPMLHSVKVRPLISGALPTRLFDESNTIPSLSKYT